VSATNMNARFMCTPIPRNPTSQPALEAG
jgi:hypothetical protein